MEAAAAEISEAADGNEVFPVQCDVRDADAVKAAIDATVEKFGLPGLPTICILKSVICPVKRHILYLCPATQGQQGTNNKDTVTSVTLIFKDTFQL